MAVSVLTVSLVWTSAQNVRLEYMKGDGIMPVIRFLFKEDEKIIEDIVSERNVKPKTAQTYYQTVSHYSEYFNKPFTKLIKIYQKEEESKVWKKRTLKKHLVAFRNHLYNTYLQKTAKIYFSKLLTIFRHLEIELSYLPKLNNKNINELPPITYEDLLTKQDLQRAYDIANPTMKAVILFQSSSGCARRETLNLTVEDYILANNVQIEDIPLKTLLLKIDTNGIPSFKLLRQKTNKYYFTYCSPRANREIFELLINRDNLTLQSPLFDLNLYYWNKYYAEINEELGLGKVRTFNKFRSHMIRKFHASTLYNDGMSIDDVDSLQGRSKDSTHQSYFMEDPILLKKKYQEHLECLLLEV